MTAPCRRCDHGFMRHYSRHHDAYVQRICARCDGTALATSIPEPLPELAAVQSLLARRFEENNLANNTQEFYQ